MIVLLKILAGVIALLGVVWGIAGWVEYYEKKDEKSWDKESNQLLSKQKRPSLVLPIVVFSIGILFFGILTGVAQIPATHIAVVENTWTGKLISLGPGTHIWPLEPRLVPFISRVTNYDLRRQIIEIGGEPVRERGVQADSNSPGRPVVSFWARGWAYPNPDKIIELHRRYGPGYQDNWIERVWVSSLKAVQGERPYDFVGNKRVEFQDLVEKGLQEQLLGEDKIPLVEISQLAIADFGFDENIEAYLNTVAQKEFERQQAEQQILINQKQQEAAQIQAETNYIITKRAAEAEQAKLIAEAKGRAEGQKLVAEAEAYQIRVKYQAETDGIKLVQEALAKSPEAYLEYQRNQRWNGELPRYMLGSVPLPFVQIQPEK